MPRVDVVVVSYNSRDRLRDCVGPIAGHADVNVIVADNASSDGSLEAVADLPVTRLANARNGGFSYGCNAGWRAGSAPLVLFLNPDARIAGADVLRLADVIERDPRIGAIGPRILDDDGSLDPSQRRDPSLVSTLAVAVFLHRLLPRASWTDEMITDPAAYDRPGSPDWLSGACLMVRRADLERLGGLDEGFFLYCEDTDLCARIRAAGGVMRYEPAVTCGHAGGASAPRASLLPIHVASRIRYARVHGGHASEIGTRAVLALASLLRLPLTRGATRRAHVDALRVIAGLAQGRPTSSA